MLFCYAGGLPERKPRTAPKQAPRATKEHSHERPIFAHLLPLVSKNTFTFALFGYRKTPRKHLTTPKKSLFLPLFSLFQPLLPCCQVLRQSNRPDAFKPSGPQPHKDRGTKGRERADQRPTRTEQEERKGSPAPKAEPEGRHQQDKPTRNERKSRSDKGTREQEKRKAKREAQRANKERDTPPLWTEGRQPFPSSQIRAKKSGKSRLG